MLGRERLFLADAHGRRAFHLDGASSVIRILSRFMLEAPEGQAGEIKPQYFSPLLRALQLTKAFLSFEQNFET